MIVIRFLWKCNNMLRRLLIKLGLVMRILFNEILLYLVDELKIILICVGFFGWYILKMGKY